MTKWFLINEDGGYHNVIRWFLINEDGGYHVISWFLINEDGGYHNVIRWLIEHDGYHEGGDHVVVSFDK